jgi:exodeoxyribonuclease VIII
MNAQLAESYPVGIFPDEPVEIYYQRRLDEANSTGLKIIDGRSPAHFKYWVENPDDEHETPAKLFGKAFHGSLLEPDEFTRTYAVLPEDAPARPTKAMLNAGKPSANSLARQDWWREWEAKNGARVVLPAADYDRAQRMGDTVRAHPIAAGLIVGGDREATLRWLDADTGMKCKARIDNLIRKEFMVDAKSCIDASPEGFARAAASYRYDAQAAHYMDGARECAEAVDYYIVLAVESEPPYVCVPYFFGPVEEQRGWALRQRAIRKQAECLRTGQWPGYADTLTQLTFPTWAHYGIET